MVLLVALAGGLYLLQAPQTGSEPAGPTELLPDQPKPQVESINLDLT
jgi:hypothetical protein